MNRFQGTNFARLCSLAGRYDNPIPARFLAPNNCSRIPALEMRTTLESFIVDRRIGTGFWILIFNSSILDDLAWLLQKASCASTGSHWEGSTDILLLCRQGNSWKTKHTGKGGCRYWCVSWWGGGSGGGASSRIHSPLLGDKVDGDIGLSHLPASLWSLTGRYDNPMP